MPGSPAIPPTPNPPGPRLALVVATSTYNDSGLRRLRAPARDATDLAQVLADPGIGGHLHGAKIGTWFARAYLLTDT